MDELKGFDVKKLNELLNKANECKKRMEVINQTYEDMQKHNDGKAKLYIYTNGHETRMEFDSETMCEFLTALHKRYAEFIRETKIEVDKLYKPFLN